MATATPKKSNRTLLILIVALLAILLLAALFWFTRGGGLTPGAAQSGIPAEASALVAEKGMTPDDVYAALKTYMPSGKTDPFIMFASGGHAGQILVIGVPSMRILKEIAVFTPEPWQGYGYGGEGNQVLAEGAVNGKQITWGDAHHPGLSETNGDYDGQFVFINDKANARIAVVDLRDFETKQIVKNPNAINDHGGTFVTPNTEYVIEGPQYAAPIGFEYAGMDQYKDKYRGLITFWAFDRTYRPCSRSSCRPTGRTCAMRARVELAGFRHSFNTELATGMTQLGEPPFEAGTSKNDTDYLHIINWQKAEEAFKAGKAKQINGIAVIPMKSAVDEGILFFAPEPKSPHGVDVTPGGEYITIGGKLDPHVTVYSFDKIKAATTAGGLSKDDYGVPVIPLDKAMEAQVELGLGPLHTVYDDKGYAYTSLFLDSAVARWTLGGSYQSLHPEQPWTLVQKLPVQYNVGHLAAAEGDTAHPKGQYVVALNKWSIDRFANVGPLLPQNFQLIDSSKTGDQMKVLFDMPVGMAEPHYAQIISADKLKPFEVYPDIGWNTQTMSVDPDMQITPDKAKVERNGKNVEVWMNVIRSHYTPERVEVNKGDHVKWHLTNIERTRDATHGFALSGYNINLSLEPGETQTIEFDADAAGTYTYYCTEFCSALHLEMIGYFLVKP
ncbi:MAG: Sec-dependent nitrous-oxide reductase [Anaerolineae bacterium]